MRKILLGITSLLMSSGLLGQTGGISPYSTYGLGELNGAGFAQHRLLGGIRYTQSDSVTFSENAAAYSLLGITRPVFNIDVAGRFETNTDQSGSVSSFGGGLNNVHLAMPFSKRLGGGFGIKEFSSSAYDVSYKLREVDEDVTYSYRGEGGVNNLTFGLSYAPIKSKTSTLSVGIKSNYFFGVLDRSYQLSFDNTLYYGSKITNEVKINGWNFEYGALYKKYLKDHIQMTVGLNFQDRKEIKAEQHNLFYSFIEPIAGVIQPFDTTRFENKIGDVNLPQKISAGVWFDVMPRNANKSNVYMGFGAEYEQQDWSAFSNTMFVEGTDISYKTGKRISLGFTIVPVHPKFATRGTSYFSMIDYKVGFRRESSYYQYKGADVSDFGISFGTGLPLLLSSSSNSKINLGVEIGKAGTIDKNLLERTYTHIFVGLTMSPNLRGDRWFVKRKYD